MIAIIPALFDSQLSDADFSRGTVSKELAVQLFNFFRAHDLFNWQDANNGCEGRADAVCVLLDQWNIPNYKAWVFGGAYLKNHVGELKQNWKYHVAPVLAVEEAGQITQLVLDPASGEALKPTYEWAADITKLAHSYYCVRQSDWYIFPATNISTTKWNWRNKQNRKWMIQCLAGINSMTAAGRAALAFNKPLLKNTEAAFKKLQNQKAPYQP